MIFSCGRKSKKLVMIPLKNGLYRLEHEAEVAAVVKKELITIEKLHRLMGHISPEAAKALVQKGGWKVSSLMKLAKSHHVIHVNMEKCTMKPSRRKGSFHELQM